MERHRYRDQGEEEKSSQFRTYLFKDHNKSVTVQGSMDVFHIEGHNNRLVLTGLIRKLVLSGHNNQVSSQTTGSEDPLVERLVISGHNNNIDSVSCRRLSLSGHNNTVLVNDCEAVKISGFTNNVYNNGELISGSQHQSHETHTSHGGGGSHGIAGLNIDLSNLSGLGVEINRYVSGVLQQCGLDPGIAGMEQNYEASGNVYQEEEGDEEEEYEGEENYDPEPEGEGEGDGEEEQEYVEGDPEAPQEEEAVELTEEERDQIINAFPVNSYVPGKDKSDNCSICLEKLKRHDVIRTLGCMHSFHQRCLDPWLQTNLICPLCRSSLISQ